MAPKKYDRKAEMFSDFLRWLKIVTKQKFQNNAGK